MTGRWLRGATLPLFLALGACSSPTGSFYSAPAPTAAKADAGSAFASLIGQTGAVTTDEAEVRELLRRSTAIEFPARLGTMFFNYLPPITEEERQSLMRKFGQDVVATGLVRSAVPVPESLGQGASLEALRKLAARLQLDVLLLVSGTSEFKRSEIQPGGWVSAFSNQANYEARSSLVGFPMDVYSGTLLPPIYGLGTTSPTLLDPTLEGFTQQRRKLETDAFTVAANQAKDALIASLGATREAQKGASPSPAASPTIAPDAAATAGVVAAR